MQVPEPLQANYFISPLSPEEMDLVPGRTTARSNIVSDHLKQLNDKYSVAKLIYSTYDKNSSLISFSSSLQLGSELGLKIDIKMIDEDESFEKNFLYPYSLIPKIIQNIESEYIISNLLREGTTNFTVGYGYGDTFDTWSISRVELLDASIDYSSGSREISLFLAAGNLSIKGRSKKAKRTGLKNESGDPDGKKKTTKEKVGSKINFSTYLDKKNGDLDLGKLIPSLLLDYFTKQLKDKKKDTVTLVLPNLEDYLLTSYRNFVVASIKNTRSRRKGINQILLAREQAKQDGGFTSFLLRLIDGESLWDIITKDPASGPLLELLEKQIIERELLNTSTITHDAFIKYFPEIDKEYEKSEAYSKRTTRPQSPSPEEGTFIAFCFQNEKFKGLKKELEKKANILNLSLNTKTIKYKKFRTKTLLEIATLRNKISTLIEELKLSWAKKEAKKNIDQSKSSSKSEVIRYSATPSVRDEEVGGTTKFEQAQRQFDLLSRYEEIDESPILIKKDIWVTPNFATYLRKYFHIEFNQNNETASIVISEEDNEKTKEDWDPYLYTILNKLDLAFREGDFDPDFRIVHDTKVFTTRGREINLTEKFNKWFSVSGDSGNQNMGNHFIIGDLDFIQAVVYENPTPELEKRKGKIKYKAYQKSEDDLIKSDILNIKNIMEDLNITNRGTPKKVNEKIKKVIKKNPTFDLDALREAAGGDIPIFSFGKRLSNVESLFINSKGRGVSETEDIFTDQMQALSAAKLHWLKENGKIPFNLQNFAGNTENPISIHVTESSNSVDSNSDYLTNLIKSNNEAYQVDINLVPEEKNFTYSGYDILGKSCFLVRERFKSKNSTMKGTDISSDISLTNNTLFLDEVGIYEIFGFTHTITNSSTKTNLTLIQSA